MKKRRLIVRHGRKLAIAACGLLMGASLLQSCSDDLLTGQPEWLGNSIYERLQNDTEGQSYSTLLRLVDDLGQTEVLSHTGSKTIFAADDAAFQRWFQHNSWGVKRYEDLTLAQKKLLLNTAMVNNAYLIELLSNASGNPPTKGASMRRNTAVTIYDTVDVMSLADMPKVPSWEATREKGNSIKVFKDATARPIFHLLPEFMRVNAFTSDDIRKLTNGSSSSVDSSWINGVRVTQENITCKNGYIHKVQEVIEPVDNMAEILHKHKNMSKWSHLLDRFSAPYYVANESREYNRLQHTDNDSVYTINYFSNTSRGGDTLKIHPDGKTVANALLIFDPGWNQYMYTNPQQHDLHYDAGAMLVPTDEALEKWWQTGGGAALRSQFHEWDSVPDKIVANLLNNNLLDAFINTIPSKFASIIDDSQVRMNVQMNDVDSCFMGCNGVVYLTNKVFAPSSFSSVAFPAQIHTETMNILDWAIDHLGFRPFLNSMETTYSLLIPTNKSLKNYLDPTLYNSYTPVLYEFYYDDDPSVPTENKVKARLYQLERKGNDVFVRDDIPTKSTGIKSSIIDNRLKDLLNSLIIIGKLKPGQEYYKTRDGGVVRVLNADQPTMTVAGGYQLEPNRSLTITGGEPVAIEQPAAIEEIFDQSAESNNGMGNGMSYSLVDVLPMASTNSLYSLLRDTPEFQEFSEIINISDLELLEDELELSSSKAQPNFGHYNFKLFDGYTYTVYVPSNEVIQDLVKRGYLPTAADLEDSALKKWGDAKAQAIAKQVIINRLADFVRYHVHDNSVFIAGEGCNDPYESSKVNPANNRFFSLHVNADNTSLKVTPQYRMDENGQAVACIDANGNPIAGQQLSVDTQSGLYNMVIREFWNQQSSSQAKPETDQEKIIYATSHGVVHRLKDGALFFDKSQLTKWEDEVNEKIASANATN